MSHGSTVPPLAGTYTTGARPQLRHRVWRVAGNVSLVFVPIVVLGILYIGFGYVLPAREQLLGSLTGVSWLAHVLPGCWLALSFGFNWVGCVVTNPGCTNSSLYRRLVAESVAAGVLPQRVSTDLVDNRFAAPAPWLQTSRQPQLVAAELHECAKQANVDEQFVWSVCRKSGALKPPLAHFCRVRGQLVLNYDHFCPWVANTIGLGNYRHFLLTVLHFTLGCIYFVVEVAPVVYFGFRDHQRRVDPWRARNHDTSAETNVSSTSTSSAPFSTFGLYGLLSLILLALCAALLVGSFGVWHLLNLASPGTTVNLARVHEPRSAASTISTCNALRQRHCGEWWQRECGCGASGGEFAVSYEHGIKAGLSYRGWKHNWARLMGNNALQWGRGPSGEGICSWVRVAIGVMVAVLLPHRRSPPWPPYCCPHLTAGSRKQRKNV